MVAGMTVRQLATLTAGVVGVAVSIALFAHVMAKPEYDVLYSGLAPADAQEVGRALAGMAIPYSVSPDGSAISVPSSQMDPARVAMAARGLPRSGQLGFELFDKPDWTGSDFGEQITYQRALEGELERTIETIHGVQSARVHLTMPHQSLFASEQQNAKAAVVLTLDTGNFPPEMVGAIQHLVASAVEQLSPKDVAILDANGDMPLDGSDPGVQQTRAENELREKILATLAPVVGAEHVQANVSVIYDPTSTDDTREIYDPAHSVLLHSESQSDIETSPSGPVAGIPGTATNLPAGAKPPGTNLGAELGLSTTPRGPQDDEETYAVSRDVDHTVKAAGSIERMTAAVVVDDATVPGVNGGAPTTRKRTPEELQQIQALAAAAIGIDPTRGDVLTVSNLSFAANAPPPPASSAPVWRERLVTWSPQLIHYGGLALLFLLIYFTLLRPLGRLTRRPGPASAGVGALPAAGAEAGTVTAMISPQSAQGVVLLRQQLMEQVQRDPLMASRLIRGWLQQAARED